jgi:hypothetical protein
MDRPYVCPNDHPAPAFWRSLIGCDIVDSLITSSTTGYDGCMMNGLQSLTQWESAFNYPSGGNLGLLNAIQVSSLRLCMLCYR